MKVIIIEDESKTAKELKQMLEEIDINIEIIAMLRSVSSAIDWLQNNPSPELIFSDIQLGDGLSFEIFKEIKVEAPVIFCTAFDEYAIRAFEANSIDYLLKPIEQEVLKLSLEKYLRFRDHLVRSVNHTDNLNRLLLQLDTSYRQNLLVYSGDKIIPIKTVDILMIHAAQGLVNVYTNDNKNHPIQYTIEQMENMLDPTRFFRANRQCLVNRDFILNIEYYFNRKLCIITKTPFKEQIIISKNKATAFLKWIEQ
jgi:two-component system response regulator LytT